MGDEVGVEVVHRRQRELQHDLLVVTDRRQVADDRRVQQLLGLGLGRAVDVHLGLDDGHEAASEDLHPHLELLVHHRIDACLVGGLDDRAHLGAEHALVGGTGQEFVQTRVGLHHLRVVVLVGEALVGLQERNDTLVLPEVGGRALALDLAVHGVLEQDGAHDPIAAEGRTGDDARPHGVHGVEHLVVVAVAVFADPIGQQRLGRAAAALVERRDETGGVGGLVELGFEAHGERGSGGDQGARG